ncbi:hypothetical protein GZH47_18340 [Paenibacillus rhizovicinus]|uniref:Uncharacterized protein n=1 Tax=Paenibacillus rhizovicinus TaxID=2704463 RepID=A0A6C0P280_9BACL|nr:hypothetical protein [Paenibacillus rhizovicinus]QHW32579.1 hypothetical protein GZH47_18340 [Paenibacillus rhizovicinus]
MRLNGYKLTLSVAVVGAALWVGLKIPTMAEGDSTSVTPGSINDPVVTKSYIDQQVADLVKAEVGKQSGGQADQGQQVEVVTVPVGKFLIADDGAEFIVRAGKAVVYSADSNGISDLTDGVDITNGKPVPNNHFILFPRGGRGVTPAPGQKTGLTVMVRGKYELLVQ